MGTFRKVAMILKASVEFLVHVTDLKNNLSF